MRNKAIGVLDKFDLADRVAVITGGAGLLGEQHARALAAVGGIPVVVDVNGTQAQRTAEILSTEYRVPAWGVQVDITDPAEVEALGRNVVERFGRVDILINNAANNPKVEEGSEFAFSRLENFPIEQWRADIEVGLTGAFLCSRVLGAEMSRRSGGSIVNVASDLALIAPDQRLYRVSGLAEDLQPVKPITYPVVKSALLGLTRYLATYWAQQAVRVNAICPGGVYNGQSEEFVTKLAALIPAGRMARRDEYQAAILFLCSDASSYMTGATLVVDGGRTCW